MPKREERGPNWLDCTCVSRCQEIIDELLSLFVSKLTYQLDDLVVLGSIQDNNAVLGTIANKDQSIDCIDVHLQ